MTGTSLEASVTDISVWQFAFSPSAVAYCGAMPTDALPVFGRAVWSMISQFHHRRPVRPPASIRSLPAERSTTARPDKMLPPVIRDSVRTGRRGLDALAITRTNQTSDTGRTHPAPRLVSQPLQIWGKPQFQIRLPILVYPQPP